MSGTKQTDATLEELQQQHNALQQQHNVLQGQVDKLTELITGQRSEKHYSVAQVAVKLGLTTAGVNFHIRKGNIIAVGGKQRFKKISESELNNFIATRSKHEA